jgi:ppGpp synthetase/RelA/SpoT-type nucleotidyltranferase
MIPTTHNAREIKLFLDEYEKYVKNILHVTQSEIDELITTWLRPEYWEKYRSGKGVAIPTPIRTAFTRIKRPEQVVDKILRKPDVYPEGLTPDSFKRMTDTVGLRVVVYFLRHIPLIDRDFRSSGAIEIVEDVKPVAYMSAEQARILSLQHLEQREKQSGYRSVHYHARVKTSTLPFERRPTFEIQVRTAVQDLWSTLEHHLGYKPIKRTHSTAKTRLRILSKMLEAIDEDFNFLYEELNRSQDEQEYSASTYLTAEVLPSVLAEAGINCNQRDINNILRLLYSRGIEKVQQILDLATPRRLEIIRNTYLSVAGRYAVNLEIIATLASIYGAADEDEEIQRIKLQIDFLSTTDLIRQESRIDGMD